MIPVPFSWFVFFYLAAFLTGVLILWAGYSFVSMRAARRVGQNAILCRICGSRYTATADLSDCPACGSRNERVANRSSS
jgi:hypothetical protein